MSYIVIGELDSLQEQLQFDHGRGRLFHALQSLSNGRHGCTIWNDNVVTDTQLPLLETLAVGNVGL